MIERGEMIIHREKQEQIVFDSSDWKSMRELCKAHEKYPVLLVGKTSGDEDIMIEILSDRIITEVFQENGWIRKNYYYPEECITEELFHGKWKQDRQPGKKNRCEER